MSLIGSCSYIFLLKPWAEERNVTREGKLLLQLLFGAGMFFGERKTIRRWIYPLAVTEMIGFWLLVPPFDLDYSYFGGDIVYDGTAATLGLVGFVIYLVGIFDMWRMIKLEDGVTLRIPWKRGLVSAVIFMVVGIASVFLAFNSLGSDIWSVIIISIVLGLFGLLFYPHRVFYVLIGIFGAMGSYLWLLTAPPWPLALWLGFGSGFILSAIISRILHAIKKI